MRNQFVIMVKVGSQHILDVSIIANGSIIHYAIILTSVGSEYETSISMGQDHTFSLISSSYTDEEYNSKQCFLPDLV